MILREAVEHRPKAFTPKYDVDVGRAFVEICMQRTELVAAMTVEKATALEHLMARKWEEQKKELPP